MASFGRYTDTAHRTLRDGARRGARSSRVGLWTEQKELMPGFAEYEEKTSRTIPVVILERASA